MTFEDRTQAVWEENSVSGTLFEEKTVVDDRHRTYDLLRACALSPMDTASLIRRKMEELYS